MAEEILEAVMGIDKIILFRPLKEQGTASATKLAFQIDHAIGITNEGDAEATKDGSVQTPGTPEYDFSMTSIMARGDEELKKIKRAVISGETYEFWEVDRLEEGTDANEGKYAATYYQGKIQGYDPSAPVDGAYEVEITVGVNGVGVEGWATLTEDQLEVVQYAFVDTTPVTE